MTEMKGVFVCMGVNMCVHIFECTKGGGVDFGVENGI